MLNYSVTGIINCVKCKLLGSIILNTVQCQTVGLSVNKILYILTMVEEAAKHILLKCLDPAKRKEEMLCDNCSA
jgi:hypothetical protein